MMFTALSTVAFLLALWACYDARQYAREAASHAERLRISRGRVIANEAAIEQLAAAQRRLQGRFDKARHLAGPADPPPFVASDGNMLVCENWRTAQIEGPQHPAASCECDFCVSMRAERRKAKEVALAGYPKAPGDKVREIERRS